MIINNKYRLFHGPECDTEKWRRITSAVYRTKQKFISAVHNPNLKGEKRENSVKPTRSQAAEYRRVAIAGEHWDFGDFGNSAFHWSRIVDGQPTHYRPSIHRVPEEYSTSSNQTAARASLNWLSSKTDIRHAISFRNHERYAINIAFRIKLVLMFTAELNALWFYFQVERKSHTWVDKNTPPTLAKVIASSALA